MNEPINLLVAEDSKVCQAIVRGAVNTIRGVERVHIIEVATMTELIENLSRAHLLVLDLSLPDSPAEKTLEQVPRFAKIIPTILYTSYKVPESIQQQVVEVIAKGSSDRVHFARVLKCAIEDSPKRHLDTAYTNVLALCHKGD